MPRQNAVRGTRKRPHFSQTSSPDALVAVVELRGLQSLKQTSAENQNEEHDSNRRRADKFLWKWHLSVRLKATEPHTDLLTSLLGHSRTCFRSGKAKQRSSEQAMLYLRKPNNILCSLSALHAFHLDAIGCPTTTNDPSIPATSTHVFVLQHVHSAAVCFQINAGRAPFLLSLSCSAPGEALPAPSGPTQALPAALSAHPGPSLSQQTRPRTQQQPPRRHGATLPSSPLRPG